MWPWQGLCWAAAGAVESDGRQPAVAGAAAVGGGVAAVALRSAGRRADHFSPGLLVCKASHYQGARSARARHQIPAVASFPLQQKVMLWQAGQVVQASAGGGGVVDVGAGAADVGTGAGPGGVAWAVAVTGDTGSGVRVLETERAP